MADADAKERFRAEIAAVYASYHRLLKGPANAEQDAADYQRLLDAGQGSCPAARLAASLAPRFLHRFPDHLDATATLLMQLSQVKVSSKHDVESVIDSTRADALRGLGNVLDVASKLATKGVPTVLRVVEFLLRQLHAHMTPSKGPSPPSPSASSIDFCNDGIDNLLIAQQLLEKAFRSFPRVVLACCLRALTSEGDKGLCEGAGVYLRKHLLFETGQPTGDRKRGRWEVEGGQEGRQGPGLRCLASEVLRGLPDTQAWLLQVMGVICQDKKVQSSQELHPLLNKLLSLITLKLRFPPADAPAQAPPPPPTGGQGAQGPGAQGQGGTQGQGQPTAGEVKKEQAGGAGDSGGAGEKGVEGMDLDHDVPALPPHPPTLQQPPPQPPPQMPSPSPAPMFPPGFPYPAAAPPLGPPHPSPLAGPGPGSAGLASPTAGALLGRGGPICRAASCLYLAYLPPALSDVSLKAECVRHTPVEAVYMASCSLGAALGLGPGEAYVVFKNTVPDAALAYEAMAETLPFGGSRPLHVEFCPCLPPGCLPRGASEHQESPYVWVSSHSLEEVLGVLRQAGLPNSDKVYEVAGRVPGFILDYSKNEPVVQAVVECLVARLLPHHHLVAQQSEQAKLHMERSWPGQGHMAPQGHLPANLAGRQGWDSMNPGPFPGAPSGAHPQAAPQAPPWMGGHPHTTYGGAHHQPPLSPAPYGGPAASPHLAPHPGMHHHPHAQQPGMPSGFMQNPHAAMQQPGGGLRPPYPQPQHAYPGPHPHQPGMPGPPRPLQAPSALHTPHHGQGQAGTPSPGVGLGAHGHMRPGMGHGHPHLQQHSAPQLPPPYPHHPHQRPPLYPPQTPQPASTSHTPGPGPTPAQQTPGATPPHTLHHSGRPSPGTQPLLPLDHHPPGPPTAPPSTSAPHHAGPGTHRNSSGGGGGASDPSPSSSLQWQGTLSKSGVQVCALTCAGASAASLSAAHRPPDKGGGGGGAPEPQGWPASLDVKLRVEVRYVEQLYCGTAPGLRAIRWLQPLQGTGGDPAKLPNFVQYLAGKERAGVIKLPAQGASPARVLYLVPPSEQVCTTLGADWPPPPHLAPSGSALLGVIVPSHDAQKAGGGR